MHGVRAVTVDAAQMFAAPRLAFRLSALDHVPNEIHGVYCIWYRDRCIYVGMAQLQTICTRLKQHWNGSHNSRLANWISSKGSLLTFSYMELAETCDIGGYENACIHYFNPLANKRHSEHYNQ